MPSARLLLVEDEPGLQLALSDRLIAEGYRVETASDGDTAVRRATGEPFDLIILDVMLPGRDGFDVARTVRQQGVHTPILMLTARGEVVDRVVGLKLGARGAHDLQRLVDIGLVGDLQVEDVVGEALGHVVHHLRLAIGQDVQGAVEVAQTDGAQGHLFDQAAAVHFGVGYSPQGWDHLTRFLRGKGFSVLRSTARGDMYVQVAVETPQNLTKRQRELLEEFEAEAAKDGRSSPESEGFFAKVKEFWDGLGGR